MSGQGKPCAYCQRIMTTSRIPATLQATRDHIMPRCKGGVETIWACLICNMIKDKKTPAQWAAFMAANPGWWKGYEYPHKLRQRAYRIPNRPDGVIAYRTPEEVRALARRIIEGEFIELKPPF